MQELAQRLNRGGIKTQRAKTAVDVIMRYQEFLDSLNTPLGIELLEDELKRMDELFIKIYNLDASDREKIEFSLIKTRFDGVIRKFNAYNDSLEDVRKLTK